MDLLLWRWSTALQLTSIVTIVAFYAALSRSTPRAELRWWLRAWLANLGALSVTLAYWYVAGPAWTEPLVRFGYLWCKSTFVWLFLQGAWSILYPGTKVLRVDYAMASVTGFALIGAALLPGVNLIGVGQHTLMAVLFGLGALVLARAGDFSLTWLAAGLAVRTALASVEAAAYGFLVFSPDAVSTPLYQAANLFLSAHSSFDTAAEWLLALGGVLAVSDRAQRELSSYNQRLLDAQEDLRRLVDRDPLTALANRRSLPEVFRLVQPHGATLLFFDLDGFKEINDLYGHQEGDDCLKQFAWALRASFRPDDAVVRHGGDEFLVVASGLTPESCEERIAGLRDRLRRRSRRRQGPSIRFSVGIAELPPGGQPQAALEAADQAMYRAKAANGATNAALPRRP